MLSNLWNRYTVVYRGLPKKIWLLASIMFVNRSGAMVLPFLSVYLVKSLNLSLEQAGNVMGLYGLGAILGAFLGGRLTDRFGYFYVQAFSLLGGAIGFLSLLWLTSYEQLLFTVAFVSVVVDLLRPANAASVAFYSTPENRTKAYSLNRLAINLGFGIGPAIGGFLATIDYQLIFWADSLTCLLAFMLFMYFYFPDRHQHLPQKHTTHEERSAALPPHRDRPYLLFMLCITGFTTIFFQFLYLLPLYTKTVLNADERIVGWLLALNGLIVVLSEMPLVHYVQQRRYSHFVLMPTGMLLVGLGCLLLNIGQNLWWPFIAISVISFGEICAIPFMNAVAADRAAPSTRGQYLGFFSVAFSSGHILAPYLGTRLVAWAGFSALWYIAGAAAVVMALLIWLMRKVIAPE
jgi:predicted MFS family arabinose efflux permease